MCMHTVLSSSCTSASCFSTTFLRALVVHSNNQEENNPPDKRPGRSKRGWIGRNKSLAFVFPSHYSIFANAVWSSAWCCARLFNSCPSLSTIKRWLRYKFAISAGRSPKVREIRHAAAPLQKKRRCKRNALIFGPQLRRCPLESSDSVRYSSLINYLLAS